MTRAYIEQLVAAVAQEELRHLAALLGDLWEVGDRLRDPEYQDQARAALLETLLVTEDERQYHQRHAEQQQ